MGIFYTCFVFDVFGSGREHWERAYACGERDGILVNADSDD